METIIKEDKIELVQEDKVVGKIEFIKDGNELTITHTIVNPLFRGQGIAIILMEKVINEAKEKGLKIIPVCSYAVSYFEKNPEYKELLK